MLHAYCIACMYICVQHMLHGLWIAYEQKFYKCIRVNPQNRTPSNNQPSKPSKPSKLSKPSKPRYPGVIWAPESEYDHNN